MYIQPQTNIKLLRNVPLDPTFDHTIWFGNATSQYNYFAGKQAFNLTDYTYQRVNKGIARVGIKAVYNMADIAIVVAVVEVDGENASIDGKKYDGIYGGATLWVYDVNKVAQINDMLKKYIQKPDAVVSIYTIPKVFLPKGEIPSSNRIPELDSSLKITSISTALTGNENIDGYKPKNKKLYTYPYNFYHVDNAGPKIRIF